MPNMYSYQNLSPDNLPGESWAAIPKLEDTYEVSNLGRIRRLKTTIVDKKGVTKPKHSMIIKIAVSKSINHHTGDTASYASVCLHKASKRYYLSVARLVYNCFVAQFDLTDRKLLIIPKDGNSLNLQASNLTLGTPKDRTAKMISSGRRKVFFPKISEEEKKKIVEKSNITKKERGTYNVSRYSLNGKLLETYPNARIAAEALKTTQGYICAATRNQGKVITACGYIWRRGNAAEIDMKLLLKERWYGSSPLAIKQKTIGQYDLQGNLVNTHTNTIEAGKAVGVHQNGIRDVIKGRGMTYGGFIWSKTIKKKIPVDPRITASLAGVSQYDLDGRWIRSFKSCFEAARETQVDNGQIHHALNGHILTAGGYLWRKGQSLRINVNELRRHPHYLRSELHRHMKRKRELAVQ